MVRHFYILILLMRNLRLREMKGLVLASKWGWGFSSEQLTLNMSFLLLFNYVIFKNICVSHRNKQELEKQIKLHFSLD